MTALPLMVAWRLEGASVLVVGGGAVALQRVRSLRAVGARVTVVAENARPELVELARQGHCTLALRRFAVADLDGVRVVLVAINEPRTSADIARRARRRGVAVNVADVPELCDFYFCAVGRRGPLQVAVSTNGQGPGLAARIRDELVAKLPREVSAALQQFSQIRNRLRGSLGLRERTLRLRAMSQTQSWQSLAAAPDVPGLDRPTQVYLVGAGPGDPELLTVKARRVIDLADLVIADRLVPGAILDTVAAEVRIADKAPGRAERSQEQIMRWMVAAAQAGRTVVRLKIGDPFVFGRGGEEVEQLTAHGLSVEVVPGVTSALCAPLSAGIPVTLRGEADRVVVMSARGRSDAIPIPPRFHSGTTFVVLMGMAVLPALSKRLLAQGFPGTLPSACVVNATCPNEQVITAALAELPDAVRRAGLAPPGVLIFGAVAARAQRRGVEDVYDANCA